MSNGYNPRPPIFGCTCPVCGELVSSGDKYVAGRVKGERRTVFIHLACWEAEQKEAVDLDKT